RSCTTPASVIHTLSSALSDATPGRSTCCRNDRSAAVWLWWPSSSRLHSFAGKCAVAPPAKSGLLRVRIRCLGRDSARCRNTAAVPGGHMTWWKQWFAKKSLEVLHAEMEGERRLRRVLGPVALTALGVGAVIGAGIFVMTGRAAREDAGPAIILSYCVAGLGCSLAALCYAEFAALVPVAGSAYTYAYATLGEGFAWIIGWDLILEYAIGCATVASGWSANFDELLNAALGWRVPTAIATDPFSAPGARFNLPAVLVMAAVTAV